MNMKEMIRMIFCHTLNGFWRKPNEKKVLAIMIIGSI